MKKVGLCVRYDCNNFGSMLQIFATLKTISSLGLDCEIVRYDKKTLGFYLKNVFRVFNPYFMKSKIAGYRKRQTIKAIPEIARANQIRLSLIGEFRKEYIVPLSKVYKGYRNLRKGAHDFDLIAVGSDQLWTPAGLKTGFYNLLFVPDDIKKVSLSTSFGVTEIPKNQRKLTAKYLSRIDELSVREQSGADIVEKLTGREAKVILDPTLWFSGDDWEEFFPTHELVAEKYVLAYFLGTIPEYRDEVERYAHAKGYKIVSSPFMDEYCERDESFGDEKRFEIGPVEFLNLIRGAECIFTDSFHGTVFSVLNEKKFVSFDRFNDSIRKSKNGRINNILGVLGLEDRKYKGAHVSLEVYADNEIDYGIVKEKLDKLRCESLQFVEKAMKE